MLLYSRLVLSDCNCKDLQAATKRGLPCHACSNNGFASLIAQICDSRESRIVNRESGHAGSSAVRVLHSLVYLEHGAWSTEHGARSMECNGNCEIEIMQGYHRSNCIHGQHGTSCLFIDQMPFRDRRANAVQRLARQTLRLR